MEKNKVRCDSNLQKKLLILSLAVFFFFTNSMFLEILADSPKSAKYRTAVFNIYSNNAALNTISNKAKKSIENAFHKLGRLYPVTNTLIIRSFEEAKKQKGDIYRNTANLLNLDLYVLLSVTQKGNIFFADVRLIHINPIYSKMSTSFRVRSRLTRNIPVKIEREIAHLHKGVPITARILKTYNDNLFLTNAGEWNGIEQGKNYRSDNGIINVIQSGRYKSIVRISNKIKNSQEFVTIAEYPDFQNVVNNAEEKLSENTVIRYGLGNTLLRNTDPNKRLIEGICIVNMGGNICLPGYGAYLSTHFMGFKDAEPEVTGIVLSCATFVMQISLPEITNNFKINFFPWVRDSDKSNDTQNLQIFLWSTIPLTFSVAYMDQLAYLFNDTEHIPPNFHKKDFTALLFSLFLPGGGLFYKGHRFAGWSLYYSEMILAGYGIYNKDSDKKKKYSISAFCAVKLFDLIYAFAAKPSYKFYNLEQERVIKRTSIDLGFDIKKNTESIFRVMFTNRF